MVGTLQPGCSSTGDFAKKKEKGREEGKGGRDMHLPPYKGHEPLQGGDKVVYISSLHFPDSILSWNHFVMLTRDHIKHTY